MEERRHQTRHTRCVQLCVQIKSKKNLFGRLHIYPTNSGGTPDPRGGEAVLWKTVGEGTDHSKPQNRASSRVVINTVLAIIRGVCKRCCDLHDQISLALGVKMI